MSLARIYTTKTVRKDWKCGKCGAAIKKGVDGRISFAVGFRGFEQTRCLKPECYPTRAERESTLVSSIYDVQDSIDFSSLETTEDFTSARDEVVAACEEVADEYESNEMFEVNEDLQERADVIRSAGDELSSWEPEDNEPEECTECGGTGLISRADGDEEITCDECGGEDFQAAHDTWLEETRAAFEDTVTSMELP